MIPSPHPISRTIPVRVPADTMPTVLDEPRVLPPGHPARLIPCAACAEFIGVVRPMVLVYVGTAPAQRHPGGAMRGTSVPVHADCAGVAAPAQGCEHVWVTALDGDDQPAVNAAGESWVHCGLCSTPKNTDPTESS